MPTGLRRFQESGQTHFVTFSCLKRRPYFASAALYDLFVQGLEDMRCRFDMCVYGFVAMPEHVHLLLSEPTGVKLAEAMHYLKLSFSKRVPGLLSRAQVSAQKTGANPSARSGPALGHGGSFWEKRYYDRNVRDYREFTLTLQYLHRNPVARGLVVAPEEWKWSSYRHYALREVGVVELESEWTAGDRERKACSGAARLFLRLG
ncbi:MAG TPA: transposase [Terriglobales bacterium]|nr:transposase [Terriglobales bacterium]